MRDIFNHQEYLMNEVYKIPHDPQARVEAYRTATLAAVDELMEALHHVPWKPWSKRELWDWDELHEELVDVFTFFVQLCNLVGLSAENLEKGYFKKAKVNKARQDSGTYGIDSPDIGITQKQLEELYLMSENGECTTAKVGCLILSRDGTESYGWNTAINGVPCSHKASDGCQGRTIHAEVAALARAAADGKNVSGGSAYITQNPCDRCHATLKAAGIDNIWVV